MKKNQQLSKKTNQPLLIHNSTAEFLMFTAQAGEQSIEARFQDETVWLTQKMMAILFNVSVPTINEHLKNIYDQREIDKSSTVRKFQIVQAEGERQVSRNMDFYNLDAIISVFAPWILLKIGYALVTVPVFPCNISVYQCRICILTYSTKENLKKVGFEI
jgi:hypothetical protein